ncbi:MAG TPA: hypothetical protein DCL44_06190 [Elusimicrobia bacterium]|nr:hypothetical protein [Elusimicrobiota bacterium]
MTSHEAERLLNIRPPFTKKQVEDAHTAKMRALNNAYNVAVGTEMDRIDEQKVKAGEARTILINMSMASPPPKSAAPKGYGRKRQTYNYNPPPIFKGGGSNTVFDLVNHILGELRRFLNVVSRQFNTTPQVATVILAICVMMGMMALFGGPTRGAAAGAAYVLVLSDPMAQVYINGKYWANAPFVNPLRVDAGGVVEFRFVNPEYPALERRMPVERERKYIFKVHLDEGTCESAEVADWETR